MNFYKRFVGDIQAKTGHLSMMEFGAYDRLLDHCYSTESELPLDFGACCRIARAMTTSERSAVDRILRQFFVKTSTGYMQHRVAEMIADARPKMEASRANGKRGGRPKKQQKEGSTEEPTGFQKITQPKPTGFFLETQTEPNDNLSQSQILNTKTPPALRAVPPQNRPVVEKKPEPRGSRLADAWQLPDEWRQWALRETTGIEVDRVALTFADYWHSKAGRDGRKTDWAATWRNWVRRERRPERRRAAVPVETFRERDHRLAAERVAAFAPRIADQAALGISKTIDAEVSYVALVKSN